MKFKRNEKTKSIKEQNVISSAMNVKCIKSKTIQFPTIFLDSFLGDDEDGGKLPFLDFFENAKSNGGRSKNEFKC